MEVRREKKVSAMVPNYGYLIVKGNKDLSEVPEPLLEDVKSWLIENGHGGIIDEW